MEKPRIPLRLRKEPLIEAIWEIRFAGTREAVADLMPGMLFRMLSDKYTKLVRLPAADIPVQVAEQDPSFHYAPRIRLENDNMTVQIGEHVVSLNCRRPYPGWAKFSSTIRELAAAVRNTGLVGRLERFSLKYVDLIELEHRGLDCLNIELKLAEHNMSMKPIQLRAQLMEDDLKHIIQIVSHARVNISGQKEPLRGVLLDIDTIKSLTNENSWEELDNRLNDVHDACKRLFFSLMKRDTTVELGPEYKE